MVIVFMWVHIFFSSRRRHTRFKCDWSSDVCSSDLHGPANALNFNDYVWQKYHIGEWLKVQDPKTGQPAVRNPFFVSNAAPEMHYATQDPNDENSLFQDTSIQALQLRGVQFLCCHTATE